MADYVLKQGGGGSFSTVMDQSVTLSTATAGFTGTYATSGSISNRIALQYTMNAGYTGSGIVNGMFFDGLVAGAGALYGATDTNYSFRVAANTTGVFVARGSTTGINNALSGLASKGDHNIGVWGSATLAKASAKNIGVAGFGKNTNATSPVQIGGYFALTDGAPTKANMAWGPSAGLVVDTFRVLEGTSSIPIASFRNSVQGTAGAAPTISEVGSIDRYGAYGQGTATVTTPGNTPTPLSSFSLASEPYNNGLYHFTITVFGTSATTNAVYEMKQVVSVASGTASFLTSPTVVVNSLSNGTACALSVNSGNLVITVTGKAGESIVWKTNIEFKRS